MIDDTLDQIVQAKDLVALNKGISQIYNEQAIIISKQTRQLTEQEVLTARIAKNIFLAAEARGGTRLGQLRSRGRAFSEILGEEVPTAAAPMQGPVQSPLVVNIDTINGIDADAVAMSLHSRPTLSAFSEC